MEIRANKLQDGDVVTFGGITGRAYIFAKDRSSRRLRLTIRVLREVLNHEPHFDMYGQVVAYSRYRDYEANDVEVWADELIEVQRPDREEDSVSTPSARLDEGGSLQDLTHREDWRQEAPEHIQQHIRRWRDEDQSPLL